jgi:hypothetical protein
MNPNMDWTFVAEICFILIVFIWMARPLVRLNSLARFIMHRDSAIVTYGALMMMGYIVVTIILRLPGEF